MTECSDQEEEDPQDRARALQHPSPALGLLGEVEAEPEVEQAGEQEVDVVGAKQGADRLVGLLEAGKTPFHVKARQQKDDDRDDADPPMKALEVHFSMG